MLIDALDHRNAIHKGIHIQDMSKDQLLELVVRLIDGCMASTKKIDELNELVAVLQASSVRRKKRSKR